MQTIAVVYRPGSTAVSDSFFITNYSSALLVGDLNIHLDDDMSTDTITFNEMLHGRS